MDWRVALFALAALLCACEPQELDEHGHPVGDQEVMHYEDKDPDREVGIEILEQGEGEGTLQEGDIAIVVYELRDIHGNVLQTNTKAMDDPFGFVPGAGEVIKGWDTGVIGMKVGEKRRLEVPYKMGYGEQGNDSIPPKADLIFEIELLALVKHDDAEVYDFEDKKVGEGRPVEAGDTVEIRYEGRLLNGRVFDKSEYHNPETGTLIFTVGTDPLEVVPGLDDGIRGMKPGGVRKLTLPPALVMGPPTMPPRQVVELEVEIVGYADPPADE